MSFSITNMFQILRWQLILDHGWYWFPVVYQR
uniref:Uncharacterized protein n=1 Tax=Arundo donax TaxID=35708 RepID=A0A0A8ZVR5_ARUDO